MAHFLERRVARTIAQHGLAAPFDRVAIALSGGPDSVALTLVLSGLAGSPAPGFSIAGLMHVHHGLRGVAADRDEGFCRALAARLGLPIEVGHFDVAALARAERRSREAAARDVRYTFFAAASARLGATRIATGHTVDDQAETVLLRLLRGAGARGVTGIRISRGPVIRPLLECRRAAVRQYLAGRAEPCCDDATNLDESIARNRVRHQLLPLIERISPGGVRALARFAALAADDEDCLGRYATEAASTVVLSKRTGGMDADGVQILVAALSALPPALARRLIRRAAEDVHPGAGFSARHLGAVLDLARADKPSGHLDLPALSVDRRGPVIEVRARTAERTDGPVHFERALAVPGSVDVPEAGMRIAAATEEAADEPLASEWGSVAVVQAGTLALPLVVRSRRPGDRIRPIGAPGRRKLQDVLVDRKIPRGTRDRVPIVVDAAGRIVWVVGIAIAEECRVTATGAGVVILRAQTL